MRLFEVRPKWLGDAEEAVGIQKMLDSPEILQKVIDLARDSMVRYALYGDSTEDGPLP